MEENTAPLSGLGVGVASSDAAIQIALSQGPANIQLITEARLPASYVQKNALPRPMGFIDWLTDVPISIPEPDGRITTRKAVDALKAMLESGLRQTESILGRGIDFFSFGVAPSLSERKRARLRALFQDLSIDAQLVNEGRAALKFCRDLTKDKSVLLYNIRINSVTSSIYRFTGDNLSADRLEISEDSGWNYLIMMLARELLGATPPQNVNLSIYHEAFVRLRNAFMAWRPDDPLEISLQKPLGGISTAIPAEVVKKAVRDTFAGSFSAARELMADLKDTPEVMALSLFPCHPYIQSSLQQALGCEVKHIDRDSVWKGLAISAWEAKGKPPLRIEPATALPRIVELSRGRISGQEATSKSAIPDADIKKASQNSLFSQSEIQGQFKYTLDRFIQFFGTLDAEAIKALAPGMQTAAEEFLARIQDQRAKKHIDRHEFGRAYQIYRKYWQKQSGYQILSAPAIGLCLNQTRNAVREERLKVAREWIQKGLYFDRHHQELLGFRKHLKSIAKKKKAR